MKVARRQRALELVWFVAVAITPRRLARLLVELRFVPSPSPTWAGLLLKRFGSA
jgi:hypothetical protein